MIKKIKLFKQRYTDKGYFFKLWFQDNEKTSKKLDYNLNSNSVFFELGGYSGDYSEEIASLFNPTIYIFEPDKEFFDKLVTRFKNNTKVKILNFALSNKTENLNLVKDGESSSINKVSNERTVQVKGILLSNFIKENLINKIDLLNMNIEGSEYIVLREMIKNSEINKIESIQIQFHKNVHFYRVQRKLIHFHLKKTHKLVWSYDFVWERWDKI